MKQIHLIERSPDVLNTVKSYLVDGGFSFAEFKSVYASVSSAEVPELVILLANNSLEDLKGDLEILKTSPAFVRIPRIIILPFEMGPMIPNIEIMDIQAVFQIPVEKHKFHSTMAKLMNRSPRRIFRIIISIQPDGSNIRYSGVSIDFSETGMAFECFSDFEPGQAVSLYFVNPKSRQRYSFKGKIARRASAQPDSAIYYGVTFMDLSGQDVKELMAFISGES